MSTHKRVEVGPTGRARRVLSEPCAQCGEMVTFYDTLPKGHECKEVEQATRAYAESVAAKIGAQVTSSCSVTCEGGTKLLDDCPNCGRSQTLTELIRAASKFLEPFHSKRLNDLRRALDEIERGQR